MRKKFTMLLASLFLVMGTAKADFTQEWRQNTVWQTSGFTAPDGVTAVAGGFSVAFMEIPVRVTSTTIGLTFDWGNIGSCALQVLGVDLVAENGTIIKSHYEKQAAGGSSDGVYSLTDLTAETEGKLRYFVGYGANDRLNDTGGTITVTGADRSNLVTLTINYSYDGNAVSSTDVRVPSGEQYAIPALTYTKIASATMNDAEQTVTNGACTITVPAEATTISVVLANNLPFEVSASYNNAIWYTLQIRTNKYMRKNGDGISVAVETPTTEDALWAFMGDPFNGITVLNKAAGEGYVLANDNGIKMKQGSATWGIYPGNGGFMLREGTEGNNYIHNLNNGSGVGYWNNNSTTTDNGSAFVVKSEAEMISLATAALNSTNTTINSYKNIEATYYLPLQASMDAAKTLLEGKTATDMMSALQLKYATETAAALLVGNSDDKPKAGDVVSLKNRLYNDYLSVDGSNDLCGGAKGTYWTLKAIEGVDDYYYLYNEEKQVYAKPLADRDNAKTSVTANEAEAGKYGFKQVGTTSYAALHDNHLGANVGDASYLHHSNWDDKKMVRWNMALGTEASHWLVSQVYPLTVVYKYNDEELTDYKVSTFVDKGETYIVPEVTNRHADFLAIESCTVNGQPLEAENGVWSVTMGANTDIEVTLKEVATVTDLTTLDNLGIYTLESERSPLLYSATNGMTTKLSSGFAADNATVNVNDINQQFAILRTTDTPENYYYLYSLGADKFVDANLNFTDTPAPVLSFEAYKGTNSDKYPWWVKISDKYVITGSGGTDGNKIHHTAQGNDDDGKRYRIGKVGSMDMDLAQDLAYFVEFSENVVRQLSELVNNKVYTVTAYDRGQWYYNNGQSGALWSTGKNAIAEGAAENVNHFAFLTVNGKTYLYSVGAQKFVVKSADNSPNDGTAFAAFSDVPTHSIDFITSNNAGFPVVVKFNGIESGASQLHISTGYKCPVILYDNPNAAASQVRIFPVDTETPDLLSVIATIENYQVNEEARGGLEALITAATTLLEKLPEGLAEKQTLSTAKDEAQAVLDQSEPAATYEQMMEKKEALATALAAVQEYPFINGMLKDLTAGSYLIYYTDGEGTKHYLKTNAANSVITVADNPEQYPMPYEVTVASVTGKYSKAYVLKMNNLYISNTSQNASNIETKTDERDWSTQAIFEKDGKCAIRLTNAIDNAQGWHGHWFIGKGETEGTTIAKDPEIANLEDLFIWTIEPYTKSDAQIAAEALGQYLAQLPTDRNIAPGVNNYSQPAEDRNFDEAKTEVQNFYNAITRETSADQIKEKKEYLEDLESRITINQPEAGKFYRVRCTGGNRYLSSIVSTVGGDNAANKNDSRFEMSPKNSDQANFYQADELLFMYDKDNNDEGILLSYSQGLYIANNHRFNEVGASTVVEFSAAANGKIGQYNVKVGDRYFYGRGNTANNHVDSGTGEPTNQNEKGYNWWLEEVTTLPVTISNAKFATLYAPVALKVPAGVTVYQSEHVDNYIDLTEVEGENVVIPANTGVILYADVTENTTYNFEVTTDEATEISSCLVGSHPKSEKNDNAKVYTLQNGDNGVGLYLFNGYKMDGETQVTTYINGFRAWVELPAEQPAQALAFRFRTPTGIEPSTLNSQSSTEVYDLMGRRVLNPTKGMYIVNGKKMVIK